MRTRTRRGPKALDMELDATAKLGNVRLTTTTPDVFSSSWIVLDLGPQVTAIRHDCGRKGPQQCGLPRASSRSIDVSQEAEDGKITKITTGDDSRPAETSRTTPDRQECAMLFCS